MRTFVLVCNIITIVGLSLACLLMLRAMLYMREARKLTQETRAIERDNR